jgi:hypothetical protein
VHFVAAARQLDIISDNTETEAGLARNFRNLIHPAVAQRQQQQCDRSSAFHCVGALDHVAEDVAQWVARGKP